MKIGNAYSYISDLCFSLGSDCLSLNQSVKANLTLSPEDTLKAAGFEQHYVSNENENSFDLAINCLNTIGPSLNDNSIDVIIYASCLPLNANAGDEKLFHSSRDVKYLMDFPAGKVQSHFRLDKAIVVGLTQQACTGMLGSIRMAQMFLQSEPQMQKILCITADRFPRGAHYEQAYNLISDGAAGCVVGREDRAGSFKILACHQITNGAMSSANDDETVGNYFNYSYRIINETLAKSQISIQDLSYIVPQNTNVTAWKVLARLLKWDVQKVLYPTIGEVGHCISGDNIINLKTLDDDGVFRPKDKILLLMAGYGLNWQCVIVEKI